MNAEAAARAKAESQLSQRTSELDRNKERLSTLQDKVDGLQAELAETRTARSRMSQGNWKEPARQTTSADIDSNTLLAEAETRRLEAEAKIASLAMQLEHQQKLKDGENLSTVIEGLEQEKQALQNELAKALASNEDLAEQLSALQKQLENSKDESEEDPTGALNTTRENACAMKSREIATRLTDFTSPQGKDVEQIKAKLIRASQISQAVEASAASQKDSQDGAQSSEEPSTSEQ